ncbi:MAG TPA: polymer-forming cytoskeletal protein [Acidobacteriaceae bacterium]|jgi:cytoskeletal protein CcmA (bactofilin family)|nr:polymer-forming cytoskeletal protein [Acidobacteriaceae bacterium]
MPSGEATAVIGKSVQIRGEVKGNEDLVIEGLVEGTITLSDHRLTVGANAHVTANVNARDVVVQGTLNGDVMAQGRVELRAGSHMSGDIHAARLSIEDNAIFSGKVELSGSAAEHGKAPAVAHAPAAAAPAPATAHFGAN